LFDSILKMNEAALQILLVTDASGKLIGIITDGDIRRAMLKGVNFYIPVSEVMNTAPLSLPTGSSVVQAKTIMRQHSIRHVPLIDKCGRVQDLIIWTDCFENVPKEQKEKIIIMAGGKGTRLDPFTKILPKPMIPLGDKPIVEIIMDKFHQQGFRNFVLSLGYKAEIVKMYFAESDRRPYSVDYICEDHPLGTAGPLSLHRNHINDTFVVTNCDVILELNYLDLIRYHREKRNMLTIVGSVKEFTIPYGVLKTEGQKLLNIDEKPNLHFLVNTGLYVLEPAVLDLIGDDEKIDMTELFRRIELDKGKIGVYPHHGKWFDIGQWEEYRETLRFFEGNVMEWSI